MHSIARWQKTRPHTLATWVKNMYHTTMSPETEHIVQEALQLPREARAFLAEKLLESLDFEEPFDVSPDWKREIARRCKELDEGLVDLVPGDTVLREARERLQG